LMIVIYRSCLTTVGSTIAQQDMITRSIGHPSSALELDAISRRQH
jgi:hypothetical protein